MTYEHFLMRLEQCVMARTKDGEEIRQVQVLKNNGVRLDGFSYHMEGRREQPTVYVNQYYREGMGPEELGKIAELVLKIQRESRVLPEDDLLKLLDYNSMKSKIFYRLISKRKNEEFLAKAPWLPWLDMAIVFYLRIPERIVPDATALIYTSHLEHWGITMGELYRTASKNMSGLSVSIEPMETFLESCGIESGSSGMYILTNGRKEYGAAVIVDPEVQRMCYKRLGEDYYVLPSSIHELILLPGSFATTPEDLCTLVQEVNENCVSPEDFLSGNVYFYSSVTGQLKQIFTVL